MTNKQVKKDIKSTESEIESKMYGIFKDINFDISNCDTQDSITKKLLYLSDQEHAVLAKLKDHDQILGDVYNYMHDSIVELFQNYQSILQEQLNLIMASEQIQAETERLEFELGELRHQEIDNHFHKRLLKCQNRLYKRKCAVQYRIARRNARRVSKAAIKALNTVPPANLPP